MIDWQWKSTRQWIDAMLSVAAVNNVLNDFQFSGYFHRSNYRQPQKLLPSGLQDVTCPCTLSTVFSFTVNLIFPFHRDSPGPISSYVYITLNPVGGPCAASHIRFAAINHRYYICCFAFSLQLRIIFSFYDVFSRSNFRWHKNSALAAGDE